MKKLFNAVIIPIVVVAFALLMWYIIALIVDVDLIVPTPQSAFLEVLKLFSKQAFYKAVLFSVLRAVGGFVLAVVLAYVFAYISFKLNIFSKVLAPLIGLIRAVPTVAIILIAIIWFGSSLSPIIISFAIVFPTLYSAYLSSLKNIDQDLIETSRLLGGNTFDNLIFIYLPMTAAKSLDESQNALSLNLKLVIAAEALAQTSIGIGAAMQSARMFLDIPLLFAYTAVSVAVCLALELIVYSVKCVLKF